MLGYNGDLKQIADYFEELFEDGKFPNRELTLEETYYFNKALKFINEMAKQLQSEKTKQMVEMVQQVNKETKFIKDNIPVSHYGMFKGVKDGTISAPAFFSMVLGEEHPFTKLITNEYLGAYNARLKAKMSFEKLVNVTIATMISQRLKGKEDWDEFNSKEFANDVLAETLWRWIPYVGTIANAIENNSDVSMITLDKINEIISLSDSIREAIESGDDAKIIKAVDDFVTIIVEALGIPATNHKDLIIGSIYQFDKEKALKIRSLTNGYSSQSMKTIYNANLEEGNVDRAKANLQVWSSMYSVYLDDDIVSEIVSLEVQGYTATPKATITYYNGDKGQRVELTKVQQQEFNQYYKLANEHVSELMNISDYQTLDSESKAKMIRKIYDTYYDYAKTKTLGVSSTNKMVNLLSATNGRLGLSKFVLGVNALSNFEATKNKTRKELVLERINKMRGYTKAEKLLLIYMCGFSLSDTNKTVLQSFLTQKGATLKDAKSLIN